MTDIDSIKKLFGSTTRVKLLDLFLNSDKEYYIREITRLIDEQINSVRRELMNLEAIGLIVKKSKDRKVYYQLKSTSDLILPFEMLFNREISKNIATNKVSARSHHKSETVDWNEEIAIIEPKVSVLIITGDLIGGSDSKIDLLLVGDNQNKILSQWISRLEKKLDKELRFTILSDKDFIYRVTVKDKFINHILTAKHSTIIDKLNIIKKES